MNGVEHLFAYGTLLDDAVYAKVTGCEPSPLVTGTLHGWERFAIPGVTYPGAIPVQHESHIVGGLRSVRSIDEWRALDDYEGSEYSRVPCVVETERGPVSAFVYRFELDAYASPFRSPLT